MPPDGLTSFAASSASAHAQTQRKARNVKIVSKGTPASKKNQHRLTLPQGGSGHEGKGIGNDKGDEMGEVVTDL